MEKTCEVICCVLCQCMMLYYISFSFLSRQNNSGWLRPLSSSLVLQNLSMFGTAPFKQVIPLDSQKQEQSMNHAM